MNDHPLAVVTGASTGIGLELAKCCARHGFDLVIASDGPDIEGAAEMLRKMNISVNAVQADLATQEGADALLLATNGRPVDALLANVGRGLGGAFLDQDFGQVRHVIDTNVTGALYVIHAIGKRMRDRGTGKILITGSIAGFIPGTFHAVYNASKAMLDSFAFALRAELKDYGVSVTCLMPGETETDFFERAGMEDTRAGQSKKQSPEDVAAQGFEAMMRGDGDVVTGWQNKLRAAMARITPASVLSEIHRRRAEPGGGTQHH